MFPILRSLSNIFIDEKSDKTSSLMLKAGGKYSTGFFAFGLLLMSANAYLNDQFSCSPPPTVGKAFIETACYAELPFVAIKR